MTTVVLTDAMDDRDDAMLVTVIRNLERVLEHVVTGGTPGLLDLRPGVAS